MKIITISRESLECFKQSWPCNGIPSEVDGIVVGFDDNGDLVDYEAFNSNDIPIDLTKCDDLDGYGLSVLFEQAKTHYNSHNNPELVDTIRIY